MTKGKAGQGHGGRLGRKLNLGVWSLGLLAGALVTLLVAWQAASERAGLVERERDSLSRLAQVVSTDVAGKFDRIHLFFEIADLWLARRPDADPRVDPDFIALVEAFRASVDRRIDIRLVSESGGLYYIPSASLAPLADVSDRGFFRVQSSPATRGFHIGDPVKSRVTGLWGIPVSFPLSSRNAGISVIFAAIELPTLEKVYESVRPKPGGSVAITRGDGILLARTPFDEATIGSSIPGPEALENWRALLAAEPTGSWTLKTRGEGVTRIIGYSAQTDPDLVVSVSSRLDEALAPWRSSLWPRALVAALMLAAIGVYSARLSAALGRLEAIQGELLGNLERLKRSDATKDKLFSVIAHDLRGPIGGMCNLLETMATDREDMGKESLDEFIGALRLASWNTYQLLENLLAWSRSQRGELQLQPSIVALLPLVEECEQVYDLSIADKGLRVQIDVEPGLKARADPERLKIVLRNLLSNAVKFSRRGGLIRIGAAREPGGVRIELRDDGIGMGREELEALFDLGATKSRSGTANERGSGFGLVLSKEIVDRHGGSLEVRSEAGAGSCFSVFLPDAEAPIGAKAEGAP